MPLSSPRQGFINWFFRLAFLGEEITLYGKGSQRRDMIYVDDAVEAFLLAGANDSLNGVSFNVGSGTFISVREIAETLVSVAGAAPYVTFPFRMSHAALRWGTLSLISRRSRLNWPGSPEPG